MGNNFLNLFLVLTLGILMGINQDPVQETIPPEFGTNLSRVDGLTKEVLKARRISEVLYYFECPESVKRGFALDKNGSVSFREARFLGFVRQSWQHVNGEKVLVSERPVPSRESRIQAKSIYQKALDEIAKKKSCRRDSPSPL